MARSDCPLPFTMPGLTGGWESAIIIPDTPTGYPGLCGRWIQGRRDGGLHGGDRDDQSSDIDNPADCR